MYRLCLISSEASIGDELRNQKHLAEDLDFNIPHEAEHALILWPLTNERNGSRNETPQILEPVTGHL